VIHGERDYRWWSPRAWSCTASCRIGRWRAGSFYYPDEGHWILKPQNALHWYGEFLAGWSGT